MFIKQYGKQYFKLNYRNFSKKKFRKTINNLYYELIMRKNLNL